MTWHMSKKESNYVFNFQEEILAYCRSDVDILRRCCLEFCKLFHDVTDIDPFRTLTITSACHLVYRTNYLPKDTITIIPPMGYCPKNNQSLFAHKWLSYTIEKNETYIQHALNRGEKHAGNYLLDGYRQETHTAYEVHGCFEDISNYFGLIKCTALPPRPLFHPVLPHHGQDKLMFALCKTCANTENQTPCMRFDAERAIQGTWCSVELMKALEKCYRILQMYKVWHFLQKSDTLLKEYIDTFAKIKLEASGYPTSCVTDEQKQWYLNDIFLRTKACN